MTRLLDELILVAIVTALLSACIDCAGDRVAAQSRPESDAVTLARALVAEADGSTADYAPMMSVYQYHADRVGTSPARIARAYSRAYRARVVTSRIAKVLAMPGVMSAARRRQWGSAMAVVVAWLAGDRAHGCQSQPHHFGDRRGDTARAIAAGWVEVVCPGSTTQAYWRQR